MHPVHTPRHLRSALLAIGLALLLAAGGCRVDRTGGGSAFRASAPADAAAGDLARLLPPEIRDRLSPWQKGTPGRWRRLRPGDPALAGRIEQLESIGYASGSRPPVAPAGATVHDAARVAPGLNFWTSGHRPGATLMNPRGQVLHEWHCTYADAFPGDPLEERIVNTDYWRAARLFPDGSVVAIYEGLGIVRVDASSRVLWAQRNGAHHDLDVAPDGTLWVLTRRAHVRPDLSEKTPVLEDFVSVLDPQTGEELRSFSLLDAYARGGAEQAWRAAYQRFWEREKTRRLADSDPADLFHTNSIEILDGRLADRLPAFRAGNLLVSMRNLDGLAVVDPRTGAVVWTMNGAFTLQHDPSVTPAGNVLVFDNHWKPNTCSKVLAFDPVTLDVRWEFAGSPDRPFYSHSCGGAEALPNGNVLLVESDNGHVLEVTRSGETVWEFWNPHRTGENGEYIASIFGLVRLAPGFPVGWADRI
jgi:hypothetical protein